MLVTAHTLSDLDGYDAILDVRSPDEFAEDHVPGSVSVPVLDNDQRALIGTLYKQVSPFEAKKRGAALVSRNIAEHIEQHFLDKPKHWKPLVYCWRGGNRSGSMVTIFRAIGWQAVQLDGGYKAYRRLVLEALAQLPTQFQFHVIGGATGSGKSALLHALAAQGAQVLDLEGLARHRGSVLGRHAHTPQPAQKGFDSQLVHQLRQFDPSRPVFMEAESKKIGQIALPDALMQAMTRAQVWEIHAPMDARVSHLMQDYAEYLQHPDRFKQQLSYLTPLFGHERINQWFARIDAGAFAELTETLLREHYDHLYAKALERHTGGQAATPLHLPDLSADTLNALARRLASDSRALL